jgi:hypothetical protein
MATANDLNKHVPSYSEDCMADSSFGEQDATDDLEEFPVLLQSGDVRDLIEAAAKRGLSAPALARRLVRDFLRQTRGVLLIGSLSARGSHS